VVVQGFVAGELRCWQRAGRGWLSGDSLDAVGS
jgi:hypothetical protein